MRELKPGMVVGWIDGKGWVIAIVEKEVHRRPSEGWIAYRVTLCESSGTTTVRWPNPDSTFAVLAGNHNEFDKLWELERRNILRKRG